MPYLVALLAFAAVSLAAYGYADHAIERRAVRASLLKIDDRVLTRLRDRQLLGPIGQRVAAPMLRRITELGRTVTPVGYVERARRKLTITGQPRPEDVDRFLVIRASTVAAIPLVLLLAFTVVGVRGKAGLLMVLLVCMALLLGPDAVLNRRMAARQLRIRRQLPDLLDLLTISVEAGLGFEQALDRTVAGVPGDLSDEFIRMLGEVRAGAGRADAMRAIDARTDVAEVRSFVLAIIQADTFGVSIGNVLRNQAKEMRVRRRQLAQEMAQKAPVKMLLPMVACVFPALFVVVLGPAVINILHGFKGH
ncbi:MAG: type II secretion system F family protein [Acidimicrobiales bacterium]